MGFVRIASRRGQDEIIVEVRDDGVGFDAARLESVKGVGISNLRLRLEELLHASLEILSSPGEGCVQLVRIPSDGGDDSEDYDRG